MIQTLKYCSFRLFFTILLFYPLLMVLGMLSGENLQAFMGDDRLFLLAFFFLILLIVSVSFSYFGKQRVVQKLESLKRKRDSKVKETIHSFERLLCHSYSAFFTPLSGERVRKNVIKNFADLLATESIDELYSRKILEEAVINGNASLNVEAFLAKAYINQSRLDDQELFCAETICLDKPDESVLLDKIVVEYLSRRSTGVKARTVFKMALMRHHVKSLEIVYLLLKDYLKNGEIDELGAWVFLHVSENREEFDIDESRLQGLLRDAYQKFSARGDELAKRLEAALEREETNYGKVDVSVAPKKEPALSEDTPITIDEEAVPAQEMVDLEVSIINKIPKDFTRRESLPLYLTGASLVGIVLFIMFFFRGEETGKIPLKTDAVTVQAKKEEVKKPEKMPEIKQEGENAIVSEMPFTIQIAALQNAADAQSYLTGLKSREKNVYVNIRKSDQNTFYRIRIGFFKDQEEARAYATKLKEKGVITSFFISSFDGGVWSLE